MLGKILLSLASLVTSGAQQPMNQAGQVDALAVQADQAAVQQHDAAYGTLPKRLLGKLSGSGTGLLRILDAESIWVAVQLDPMFERNGRLTAYRVFRFVPGVAVETLGLPDCLAGCFEVTYDRQSRTAKVNFEGRALFLLCLAGFPGEPPILCATVEGTPLVWGARQVSATDFSPEAVESSREGAGQRSRLASDVFAELDLLIYRCASLTLVDGEAADCRNCSAGGPGSTGCSVGGCPGNPNDCSIDCGSGYWACCKCRPEGGASCACCKASASEPPVPPPGGG